MDEGLERWVVGHHVTVEFPRETTQMKVMNLDLAGEALWREDAAALR